MKRLIIPLAILVVFLIAWLIQNKIEENQMASKTIEGFLDLKADSVTKIVVSTPEDTLKFEKDGDKWFLQDTTRRRADSMAVKTMINNAADMTVGDIISQNPDRQSEFQVDSINGILVEFYNNDNLLASVIAGKPSQDFSHTFVRKPNSDDVYLANGLISYVYNRKRTQWYDKTIFSFVPGSISDVEMIYPDKSYKLALHDSIWYISKNPHQDSIVADSMKAEAFINSLIRIDAIDFANASDSGLIDFKNPPLILNVTLSDGSEHRLTFAKENPEESRIYCKKPEYDDIFVIYRSKYANYKKTFVDFIP